MREGAHTARPRLLLECLASGGRGALVFAAGAVAYGAAEALVNTAVGLHLRWALWAVALTTYGVIGLVAGAVLGAAAALVFRRPVRVALLMAGFLGGLVLVHVALPLNDRYLPWLLAPVSLLANALLAGIALGVGVLTHRRLAALAAPARASAFLALALCLGLALAAAAYLDMFVTGAGGVAATVGVYAGLLAAFAGVCWLGEWVLRSLVMGAGWGAAAASGAAALLVGVGLATGTVSTHAAIPAPGSAERPNILWIILDTVRADHLSVYGYSRKTSPNLEALAADGVVFDTAMAQASWTIPSHYQMVTSRFAAGKSKILDDEFVTAAELFRQQGYRTGAVLANFSLGRRSGFEQGFERYVDGPVMIFYLSVLEKLPVVEALLDLPFVPGDAVLRFFHRKTFLEGVAARADAVNDHALEFVDEAEGAPFFLFLNYMDAHDAYDPPPAYRDRFVHADDVEIGFVRYNRKLGGTISSNQFVRDVVPTLTADDWHRIVGLYDAEIAYLDDQVGRLLDGLRARGLYDRTIVVVTADHGELMGEHGLANHFKALTEEEIHVPLIVRYPRALPTRRVATPVQLADILPTLSEVAGLAPGPAMDGRSLLPLVAGGPAAADAEAFSFLIRGADKKFPHTAAGHLVAMRSGQRKFVWSSTGMHAYYDLATDPDAEQNLYGDTPEVAALARRLDEWRRSAGLERFDGGEPMDRLTRERLRALGYIQ